MALECGWIVTEVGRQPWVVYEVMRTKDAVTGASGVWVTFALVLLLYAVLGIATVITLRAMARRWREADEVEEGDMPYGPRPSAPRRRSRRSRDEHRGRRRRRPLDRRDASTRCSAAPTSAPASGPCWPAAASGAERPRELIDWAIGPVWEANHVWLIFVLVVLWTAFSDAFEAIISTLFIPLSLAALGIVLRGSGFAFQNTARKAQGTAAARSRSSAISSLLTPFFMGTVVGAIASGRVPVGNAEGDAITSWLNPALAARRGALFVATCAYLAAVFLVSDARRAGAADLERYFATRALAAAVVAGALARRPGSSSSTKTLATSTTA